MTLTFAMGLSLGSSVGCTSAGEPQVTIEGADGKVAVTVELALTRKEQSRGLMWRESMPEDHGMLFVFADERPRSFWMKNTPLPLDIVYISEDGRIVSIAENTTPYSVESIPSGKPARYVLEVNGGFCAPRGIGAGNRVELPEIPAEPGS